MDNLGERLQRLNEAGIYRLGCSLEELRGSAEQCGYRLMEADLSQVTGKGAFLAAIARAIKAPDWFGHNFDALNDALGDLSWLPAPGYVLLLQGGGETFGLSATDHDTVTEIFSDTVQFRKSQGTPFWVFLA